MEPGRGEATRTTVPLPEDAVPNVSLRDWLTRDGVDLIGELDRLYVPRNDPRWLRRNALYALGNTGASDALPLAAEWAASDDPMLSDAATWAGDADRGAWDVSYGRFAVLAHEVRSPVAALTAIAEAYAGADDAGRRRLLELAGAAVTSLERLLTDAAAAPLRLERVDAGRLVMDVVDTAALAGASIVTELEAGLDVDGDPERLRQALGNLVANAIGHSPAGATVTVTVRREDQAVVIAVTDEGDGIASDDVARVFEPGVRLTAARPGSGLGLAVVRTIVDAHGGEIEVESSPGHGATFRLVLPGASGAG